MVLYSEVTHSLEAGDGAVDIHFLENLALLIHTLVASFSLNEVRKPDCIILTLQSPSGAPLEAHRVLAVQNCAIYVTIPGEFPKE